MVVVSFNPDVESGRQWDEEVGSPFLHVMDPATPGSPGDAGSTYLKWGFRKSFIGVWSPASLKFYSDQKLGGRELHPSKGQDVHRMGGDLLLDGEGTVVLDHYSKTNQDRPLVTETLLPLFKSLDAQRRAGSRRQTSTLAFGACVLGAALASSAGSHGEHRLGRFLDGLRAALGAMVGFVAVEGFRRSDSAALAGKQQRSWEIEVGPKSATQSQKECIP